MTLEVTVLVVPVCCMLAKQLQSEIQNKEKEEEPPIQKQPQSPI